MQDAVITFESLSTLNTQFLGVFMNFETCLDLKVFRLNTCSTGDEAAEANDKSFF